MGSLWKHIISHQCDINFCESFRWAAARCNKIYITAPQKKCFLDVTIIFIREEWEETKSYNNSHEAFICVKKRRKGKLLRWNFSTIQKSSELALEQILRLKARVFNKIELS